MIQQFYLCLSFPKKMKCCVHTKIAPDWKKTPNTHQQEDSWYIHIKGYYLAIKKINYIRNNIDDSLNYYAK